VGDGEAALCYLSGKDPYSDRNHYPLPVLILLDLKLPRKSGAEVLAWLKQQPTLKRVPVVVLTSSNEYADINNVYDLGVNAYMVKPVTFDTLVNIVQMLNMHWIIFNEKPHLGNA
jgi:CheY-like chemotaxis protein